MLRSPHSNWRSSALILSLLALTSTAALAAPGKPRTIVNFDRSWKFQLGDVQGADKPDFDDSSWRSLDLPHDWSIEGPPNPDAQMRSHLEGPFDKLSPAGDGGGYLDGGVGWYRKTFTLPESDKGKRITILFDGAYENADVTINGQELGKHPYGFTSFYFDLTPHLKFGNEKNVLAVRLQADQPGCRWYSGAGIYRHVWLITTNDLHVAQWGTYVTTPSVSKTEADVKVATQVQNDGAGEADVTLATRILDPDGKELAKIEEHQQIGAGASAEFNPTIKLPGVRLWSCETPVLYHAVSEVRSGNDLVDSITTPFGIRTIEFTKDKGFFLNGQRVQIQGVCDHHDLGCLGAAAYRRAIQRQLEVLKSFGCNALRTSHNPPSPELLDLCDQMGFLVMDESFDEWKANHHKFGYGDFFDQWSERDMLSMLHRDRNHPSIILWSIGNEIIEGRAGRPEAGAMAQRLVGFCHREDPTRPVTSACPSPANDWKCGLAQALDVFGINYNIGWYGKNDPEKAASESQGAGYHGQLPMIGSETASQVDSRGEYGLELDAKGNVVVNPKPDFQVSSYDYFHPGWAYSAETDVMALKAAPWVAGEFCWTGFDYLGEPTPFAWPSRSSYFGIVDLAGFPKDRYYLYKSQWSSEPLVHILPMSWTWPKFQGKVIHVRAFTNAESVELFLNGQSLGYKHFPQDSAEQTIVETNKKKVTKFTKVPGMHLEWEVPYQPGELKAVASSKGSVVATDIVRTAGEPAKIILTPDRAAIAADGQDLSFITVKIVDANGVVCPDADNEIQFDLHGSAATIAGLDNGDATNHEFFQGKQHKACHGLALVVLKSKYDAPGTVELTASAEALTPAKTDITTAR